MEKRVRPLYVWIKSVLRIRGRISDYPFIEIILTSQHIGVIIVEISKYFDNGICGHVKEK